MDISDATISLDNSAGVSPLADEDEAESNDTVQSKPLPQSQSQPLQQQQQQQSPVHHNHNNHAQTENMQKHTHNENDIFTASTHQLDNRMARPRALPLEAISQRSTIARTLANSHPLMSPNGTDSDSEQGHCNGQMPLAMDIKCHNFPDVVPNSERLQSNTPPANVSARNNLNSLRGKVATAPPHNKLALLRTHSPDLLSSESDADVSQYHAAVESDFQAVALISNIAASGGGSNKATNHRGKKHEGACCDDISSLDSISNHSFDDDEDIEHNLASLSPSSSLIDGLDDDNDESDCDGPELLREDDTFFEATTPTPTAARTSGSIQDALPQYSAAEERRDSRNWQKITLPDGRTREIDMRVIEPYKRVLSHGGYLKAGGHNAIVIFCACHLPDRSRADYNYVMDNLFLYVVKTLEQLVTEDYVLIYLHGGSNRRNVPPFPWLKKCYQLLDRRLRKSLKNLYLVHPTFWIKSIVWMARPFVSTKFWRKLIYVKSLAELGTHVAVEKAAIPDKVKQYDAKHN